MTGLLPARRMRSNIRWNLVGNVAYALGQWVQLIILARMGGPAAVGVYVFALSLTAPVMMLGSLCLRFVQACDVRRAYAFREYLGLRGATTAAAVAAIGLIAWGTGGPAWARRDFRAPLFQPSRRGEIRPFRTSTTRRSRSPSSWAGSAFCSSSASLR